MSFCQVNSDFLWLGFWSPTSVYSANSNPVGLLKIVNWDWKYAQIAQALKNICLQDAEEMKCYVLWIIFLFHNWLSAKILTNAWWGSGSWHMVSLWLLPFLYPSSTSISHHQFSFRVRWTLTYLPSLWYFLFFILFFEMYSLFSDRFWRFQFSVLHQCTHRKTNSNKNTGFALKTVTADTFIVHWTVM